ncbi:MAG TPA: hypothetical protein VK638_37020 [Edaphobacter sp.]|nr:hypothetical protein [Edaphobacter sp.]
MSSVIPANIRVSSVYFITAGADVGLTLHYSKTDPSSIRWRRFTEL